MPYGHGERIKECLIWSVTDLQFLVHLFYDIMMRSYVVFINFGHFKSTIILSHRYKEAKVRRGTYEWENLLLQMFVQSQ